MWKADHGRGNEFGFEKSDSLKMSIEVVKSDENLFFN